ncbi:MFS general substrate transporter [Epithele typhae]|uniref:MFS general substrate transporter n=1 Tax=Epithele typhae TaxID=378194 RepID=UPI002007CAAB|nr:MFS general substrate transporter [Epithele typhae]KAH9915143.1 MFS general substrate transporter [Epithele typhae]
MTGGFSSLPGAEEGGLHGAHLAGVARILGPRWAQLPAITIGLLGVQVFWSVEMSYGTPYLLSLGLSKATVAMVFLAGPVSGLVVQPLIGVMADNSKSRFGRRRPYMVVGCIICTFALLLLGFTRSFASIFTALNTLANDTLTIWLAIFALFTMDFSINAVQAVDRALIVDTLPPVEQADANAWAARMLGFGSVAGYFIGNVDMTAVFPFFGSNEIQVLAAVGAILLVFTHAITAICTKEKVVIATRRNDKSFLKELRDLWGHAFSLPPVIRQICMIQFFSWVGWFPVLFYTSAFIGDLHKRTSVLPSGDPELNDEATRLGTRALFYSSLVTFAGNILLPLVVAESARSRRLLERKLAGSPKSNLLALYERLKVSLSTLWAASHLVFSLCMLATFFYSSVAGATFFTTLTGFSWAVTQWAPFSLLAEAILTEQVPGEEGHAIVLNDTRTRRSVNFGGDDDERQFLVGNDEDEDEDEDELQPTPDQPRLPPSAQEGDVCSFSSNDSMDSNDGDLMKPHRRTSSRDRTSRSLFMHNGAARTSHVDMHSAAEEEVTKPPSGLASKVGIIIGIHNIFVVIPQFIMTGIASVTFALLDPTSGAPADSATPSANSTAAPALVVREGPLPTASANSYVIIYRLAGLSALVAFVLTLRLGRELRHH